MYFYSVPLGISSFSAGGVIYRLLSFRCCDRLSIPRFVRTHSLNVLPVLDSLFCYCSGKPHNEPNYGSVGPELHPVLIYLSCWPFPFSHFFIFYPK